MSHPWDPKGPLHKSAELASVGEGWSRERKPWSRPEEVMWPQLLPQLTLSLQLYYVIQMPPSLNLSMGKRTAG